MPDILIRNVTEDDLAQIDEQARRHGLSRNEFLRRTIRRQAQAGADRTVTHEDWERLAHLTSDLLDPDFERRMWDRE